MLASVSGVRSSSGASPTATSSSPASPTAPSLSASRFGASCVVHAPRMLGTPRITAFYVNAPLVGGHLKNRSSKRLA